MWIVDCYTRLYRHIHRENLLLLLPTIIKRKCWKRRCQGYAYACTPLLFATSPTIYCIYQDVLTQCIVCVFLFNFCAMWKTNFHQADNKTFLNLNVRIFCRVFGSKEGLKCIWSLSFSTYIWCFSAALI